MAANTGKSHAPLPSFKYELAMQSRRAYEHRDSTAWILDDKLVAHRFAAAIGVGTPGRNPTVAPSADPDSVECPVGGDVDVVKPAGDIKFYCFYGVIGLALENRLNEAVRHHWLDTDGKPTTAGYPTEAPPGGHGVPADYVELARRVSRRIPAPFVRIDFTASPEGPVLGGIAPRPDAAAPFNRNADVRLGRLMVSAAGRLHADLLDGKDFSEFRSVRNVIRQPTSQEHAADNDSTSNAESREATSVSTSSAIPSKNYATWKTPHFTWKSLEDFHGAAALDDGVHSVVLPSGATVDVFIRGNPFNSSHTRGLLVFLAGAVTQRESKAGPFFTGLGIAESLQTPLISIADPTLDTHPQLGLAWFTGRQRDGVQDGIADILHSIAARAKRELLLVGGSGGGFASLFFASRLGEKCSTFVWNAQTDLLHYSPRFVKEYLHLAMGFSKAALAAPDWLERSRRRMQPVIETTILAPGQGLMPRRVFYLQNAGDWHVQRHFAPWARANGLKWIQTGMYAADVNHVALVAHSAPGHQPPPTELVRHVIGLMQDPLMTARRVSESLREVEPIRSQDPSTIPDVELG